MMVTDMNYCDYSRIIKRPGAPTPDKQLLSSLISMKLLLVIVVMYLLATHMVLADTKNDIPSLPNGIRATDLVDFRPRVKPFDLSTNASPFGFSTRQYESTFRYVITPDETSSLDIVTIFQELTLLALIV